MVSVEDGAKLERLARSQKGAAATARRARMILLLAEGHTEAETARRCGQEERTVRRWGRRFSKQGLAGLRDRPRSGRPPLFSPRSALPPHQAGVRASLDA
jgi:transposase